MESPRCVLIRIQQKRCMSSNRKAAIKLMAQAEQLPLVTYGALQEAP